MTFMDSFSLAFPEIFLAIMSMVLLLVGVFNNRKFTREIGIAACLALLFALFLINFGSAATAQSHIFGGAFAVDGYARFAKTIIYIAAIFAILLSDHYMAREKIQHFEYPILILLSVIGMSLMVSATDLISVYMGIELQSLALYILATFKRDSYRSTEAGLKYFILGALSSCLLLYGASLIYGFTGATGFTAIAEAGQGRNVIGLVFGLVFFMSGLAFKVSAAPFHMWTPDVYEGSPTPVTAFFAAAPKFAGMALFARVMVEAFPNILDQWQQVMVLICILSMGVGAFSALVQTNIKRLMAYSSIGHMGYALMGIATGTQQGVQAMLVYMAVYLVMTIGTFACILSMKRPEGMAENISDLAGLSRTRPGLALTFTVLFLSLAGIPPLLGFFPKFFIFMAAVDAGLYILAIIGAILSVVSAVYYLGVVRTIWFADPAPEFDSNVGVAVNITVPIAGIIMVIGIVLLPFLIPLTDAAATALFLG